MARTDRSAMEMTEKISQDGRKKTATSPKWWKNQQSAVCIASGIIREDFFCLRMTPGGLVPSRRTFLAADDEIVAVLPYRRRIHRRRSGMPPMRSCASDEVFLWPRIMSGPGKWHRNMSERRARWKIVVGTPLHRKGIFCLK